MFIAGGDPKDPLAAPVYADHTGLAPLYIRVGSHEALLDDTNRIVAKATEADVDVRHEVVPEMQHVSSSRRLGLARSLTPRVTRRGSSFVRQGGHRCRT